MFSGRLTQLVAIGAVLHKTPFMKRVLPSLDGWIEGQVRSEYRSGWHRRFPSDADSYIAHRGTVLHMLRSCASNARYSGQWCSTSSQNRAE
jgi:hypothetical protein